MIIETRTIAISEEGRPDTGEPSQELINALGSSAKSRATRLLLRQAGQNDVHCNLRVPLLGHCKVQPKELARALRQLCRAVIDAAGPGEKFIIDFHIDPESRLVMQAARQA